MIRAATAKKWVRFCQPGEATLVDKTKISFVYQSCALQGVATSFIAKVPSGDDLQFVVHKRHEPVESTGVACSRLLQQLRDFSLNAICHAFSLKATRPVDRWSVDFPLYFPEAQLISFGDCLEGHRMEISTDQDPCGSDGLGERTVPSVSSSKDWIWRTEFSETIPMRWPNSTAFTDQPPPQRLTSDDVELFRWKDSGRDCGAYTSFAGQRQSLDTARLEGASKAAVRPSRKSSGLRKGAGLRPARFPGCECAH